ncbi:hypothetical protein HELRODRAFT_162720 [Helobdella robusta]|uniref:Uncharacterized protein n=1 Tax=Helobdella robusta TaxID=6412 RepID=T1ET18_HELRO|nr:hypothetical protein HELRODRAFT_162720 [Helobdella robusta]ESN99209.1 hypothetical protein HELRODRAFT_162720 [Helobdella robusta]
MGNKQSTAHFDDKFGKKQPGRRMSFLKKNFKKSKMEDDSHQSPVVSGSKNEKSFDSLESSNVSTTKNSPALTNKTPESNKIQIKIFRSITNLNDNGRIRIIPSETPTNFRVFKKNVSSETLLVNSNNTREQLSFSATSSPYLRSYSLPRAFVKNRMARTSAALSSSSVENFDSMKSKKLISRSSMSSTSRASTGCYTDPNSKNYKGSFVKS